MRHGEADVLWPGTVRWYAKSSGTTADKSKFIPVSREGLKKIHYAGGADTVAVYLRNNPKSRLFDGRALILGGSHSPNYNLPDSLVGDLSSILIENINPVVNLLRVPDKKTALLSDRGEARPYSPADAGSPRHQYLGSALLDAVGACACARTQRQAHHRRGMAKPRSVLPRRHRLHAISQPI